MKKSELIAALAELSGESQAACGRVLDALPGVAIPALVQGKSVPLTGLGKLAVKRLAARTVRNPRDGRPVEVPERQAVRFRAGGALKEAMEE
jgi:DNA-binding protein HU-beta